MEGKEEMASVGGGVTVRSDEAPPGFKAPPISENTDPNPAPIDRPPAVSDPAAPAAVAVTPASGSPAGSIDGKNKKKRGRPRKYGPDGAALSPMPISASIPLTGEFSPWQRGRVVPVEPVKKKHKVEYESPGLGNKLAYFVGANFTPHVITVNPGEDVTMKVMSFSQQGSRAICVLSANGTISNVSLRQPTSSGGTLTYEGRFEILSLSGSYMPVESGGTMSRSGGMSVSLAGPDGRVLGGGLAGLLLAAGPVQVVVGSFLPGHQQEHKPKKQRVEAPPILTSTISNPVIREETAASYGGVKLVTATTSPYNGENIVPVQSLGNWMGENKISFSAEESNGLS
ncbi:AT-hook motif nuclear-localized protein 6-like isoform X2 [Punica granatum]|uniref:AT-hook motif nuclear-localized protein n=2 Tax=Punica granatum TaxID=22663 RepID=A0A6P8CR21_PUNGR|nr:AT-hook motif nuclear-localized protein 6-like isoform X2 [Punica granatum]